ncbi:histidine kinase [Acetobacteraceae bacterium EV16G]|uniref:ATP-binding protein n=1 Tax=Sorlinia euscelidii TaxID=3081148 RepID=UPI002F37C8FE
MVFRKIGRRIERPLRRFLPRSLFGRSLLIVFVPLFVTQLVAFQLFYGNYLSLVSRRLADSVVAELAMTVRLVARFPNERDWILDQARREQQLVVTYGDMSDAKIQRTRNVLGPMYDDLQDAVRRVFHTSCRIDWHATSDNVRFELPYRGGLLSVEVPRKRLVTGPVWFFLAWAGGSATILFGIAGLFIRNQVRVIRGISHAAEQFGIGRDDGPIHPRGAREVRKAAVAFNRMQARVNRFVEQRTIVLAGVSHDLRTPLTRLRLSLAMIPNAGVIEAEALRPDIADMVSDIAEMEALVNSYLTFARGEGAEAPVETDLSALLRRIAADTERAGGRITHIDIPDGISAVVRPDALRRALANIVENARTHGGNISITLNRRETEIFICIDDDGEGIPPHLREEVFQLFSRNRATVSGSGLGLTIARDIMRAHGGEITLLDSPRGGLRVLVRLPTPD